MRINPLYALIGLLLLVAPAVAQVSKSTLATDISTSFPDQNTGAITPATTRSFLNTLVNSFQQYTGIRNVTGATDTIAATDYGQLILYNSASAIAVTIPQAMGSFSTFNVYVRNLGAGTATVTPSAGTINGAGSLSVATGQSYWLVSDGSNWQVATGSSIGFTGTGLTVLQTSPTLITPNIGVATATTLNGQSFVSAGGLDLVGIVGVPNSLSQAYSAAASSTAVCTGSASGTVLMVMGSCASGAIAVGQTIFDVAGNLPTGSNGAARISSFGTGSGGAGTYNLSVSVGTIGSETIYFGAGHSFAAGVGALHGCTTCYNNVAIGNSAGFSTTTDIGNIYIGNFAGQLLTAGNLFNTVVGDSALDNATTSSQETYIGRGAGGHEVTGDHNTGAGHASFFFGTGNRFTSGFGDESFGMPVDGSGTIPTGNPFGGSLAWRNQGTVVYGASGDINLWCIAGEDCGKATSAARFDAGCVGSYCRIPAKDHGMWMGNGYDYVGTSGSYWEGGGQGTINNNAGVTLTCAQVLNGIIDRTGTPTGAVTDTLPSAAAVVSCVGPPGGPGNSSEVPIRHKLAVVNHFSANFTYTISGGAGNTIAGPAGPTVGQGFSGIWDIIITNSTSGSEAITYYRLE